MKRLHVGTEASLAALESFIESGDLRDAPQNGYLNSEAVFQPWKRHPKYAAFVQGQTN